MDLLKESIKDLPGITVEIEADEGGPSFDPPIELDIYGDTEEQVNEAVTKIENYMRNNMTDLNNIFSSKAYPSVEWSVEVDKQKAAQLGVSVSDVGALVQMLTSGFKVGEYRPDDAKDETRPCEFTSVSTYIESNARICFKHLYDEKCRLCHTLCFQGVSKCRTW